MKKSVSKNVRFFTTTYENGLSSLMSKLWKHKLYADVNIIAGNEHFLAHKAVLTFYSPLLADILSEIHGEPTITLDGVASEDLRSVLDILYTGEVKLATDKPDSVLQLLSQLGVVIGPLTLETPPNAAQQPRLSEKTSKGKDSPGVFIVSADDCRGIKNFNCPNCSESFDDAERLFHHVKKHVRDKQADTGKSTGEETKEQEEGRKRKSQQPLSFEMTRSGRKRIPKSGLDIFASEEDINVNDSSTFTPRKRQKRKKFVSIPHPLGRFKNSVIAIHSCKKCKAEFPNHWLLELHNASECENYPVACKKCVGIVSLERFQKHVFHDLFKHCDGVCPVCPSRTLGGVSDIDLHIEGHVPSRMKFFCCGTCDKRFLSKKAKTSHSCRQNEAIGDKTSAKNEDVCDAKKADSGAGNSPIGETSTVRIIKPVKKIAELRDESSTAAETDSLESCIRATRGKRGLRGRVGRSSLLRGKTSGRRPTGRGVLSSFVSNLSSSKGTFSLARRGTSSTIRRGRNPRGRRGATDRSLPSLNHNQAPAFRPSRGARRSRLRSRNLLTKTSHKKTEICEVCTITLKTGKKATALHRQLCFQKLFTSSDTPPGHAYECHFCKSVLDTSSNLRETVDAHYTSVNCPVGYDIRTELTKNINEMVVDDFGDTFLIEIDQADEDDEVQYVMKPEPTDYVETDEASLEDVEDLSYSLSCIDNESGM